MREIPGQAPGGAGTLGDADRALLEARARALAKRARSQRPDDVLDVVVFSIRGESYALELQHLRQVLAVRELALLPGVPPPLVALSGWRGELLAVFDLALLLDRSAAPAGERRHLLVVGERTPFGLLVDDVLEMTTLHPSALTATAGENPLVRGITPDAVLVLDGPQLLRTLNREAT